MPYNTKKIITDVTGRNPVPAYFNPDTDQYEPLFGQNGSNRVLIWGANDQPLLTQDNPGHVQLTGSNVELEKVLDFPVTAGSTVYVFTDVDAKDYKYVSAIARTESRHEWSLGIDHYIKGSTFGNTFGREEVEETGLVASTGFIENLAGNVAVIIRNKDTVDHNYDVILRGII